MTDDDRPSMLLRELFLAGFMSALPATNAAWAAARLATTMSDLRLEAGDVLYRKGEPTDDHFFIVDGELRLETDDAPPWTFGERSLIGSIDLLVGRPRSRNAVATRSTHLLRMPGQEWLDMLEDNFELTRSAIEGLAGAIHELRVELGAADAQTALGPAAVRVDIPSGPLGLIDRILVLRSIALFAEANVQALTDIALLAREEAFAPGDAVVAKGESSDSLVVVLSGDVGARRVESGPLEHAGAGQLVLGAGAAAAEGPHEARAEIETRVLSLSREDYLDVMEEHFALGRSALKALSLEREALFNARGRRRSAHP